MLIQNVTSYTVWMTFIFAQRSVCGLNYQLLLSHCSPLKNNTLTVTLICRSLDWLLIFFSRIRSKIVDPYNKIVARITQLARLQVTVTNVPLTHIKFTVLLLTVWNRLSKTKGRMHLLHKRGSESSAEMLGICCLIICMHDRLCMEHCKNAGF